jgi:hypothetical protein
MVAASNTFALRKKKYEFRFLLEISWLLEMHFSTQGTPVARFAVGAQ